MPREVRVCFSAWLTACLPPSVPSSFKDLAGVCASGTALFVLLTVLYVHVNYAKSSGMHIMTGESQVVP